MNDQNWDTTFRALFERCAKLHHAGDTRGEKWFTEAGALVDISNKCCLPVNHSHFVFLAIC